MAQNNQEPQARDMANANGFGSSAHANSLMDIEPIPISVLREHDGKWIIWDEEDRRVLGVGVTLEEAQEQADREKTGHLLRYHHANW
jgi:hypothetical protein